MHGEVVGQQGWGGHGVVKREGKKLLIVDRLIFIPL